MNAITGPRSRRPSRYRKSDTISPSTSRYQGLTSAIHDAQNLCWKLALVLAGHASPALLDTYQAERRPADERNAQRSLENAAGHFAIGAALALSPENTPGQNMAQLRRMRSGRPRGGSPG